MADAEYHILEGGLFLKDGKIYKIVKMTPNKVCYIFQNITDPWDIQPVLQENTSRLCKFKQLMTEECSENKIDKIKENINTTLRIDYNWSDEMINKFNYFFKKRL